jgi:Rrf2 family transcriptional regulator, iron-sulfur cluster assembly transcription factor
MYVSARLDYALRALATLAAQTDARPLTNGYLAERLNVSDNYLGPIMTELRYKGLILSKRGRKRAGYHLARPATEISVQDVVAALSIWPVDIHTTAAPRDEVSDRLAALWQQVGGVTNDVLASVSLADIAGTPAPITTTDTSQSHSTSRVNPIH